jgi:hypothetical protein
MPDTNNRLRPVILAGDENAIIIIRSWTDYNPANTAYATTALDASLTAMKLAQENETKLIAQLAAARDAARVAEWAFHDAILGAKDQVVAQYGPDSDQIQALGLKKKSERKRRATPASTP